MRGDLAQRGVVSKSWTSSTNVQHGGAPFDRGALYCLLRNRTYVGEVTHKGAVYPGEHDLIVARDLFDAVQCRLADTRKRQKGKRSSTQETLLSGILFDEAGAPMTPTYSVKPDGRRYRYYASPSTFRAETAKVSLPRIPAIPLETFVEAALRRIGLEDLRHSGTLVVRRVDIRSNTIVLTLDRVAAVGHWRTGLPGGMQAADILARWSAALSEGETLQEDGEVLVLTLPVRARFRGGRSAMIAAPGTASASGGTDAALIRAVACAYSWKEMLMSGKVTSVEALAKQVGQERRHVTRTLAGRPRIT